MKMFLLLLLAATSAQDSGTSRNRIEVNGVVQARDGSQIRVGPITTKDRVSFRLPAKTLNEAMTTIVRLRVDSTSVSAPYATLTPPRTCNRQGQGYECEAYIPANTVTSVNIPGRHDIYSFTFDGNCCESAPSGSWTITTPK